MDKPIAAGWSIQVARATRPALPVAPGELRGSPQGPRPPAPRSLSRIACDSRGRASQGLRGARAVGGVARSPRPAACNGRGGGGALRAAGRARRGRPRSSPGAAHGQEAGAREAPHSGGARPGATARTQRSPQRRGPRVDQVSGGAAAWRSSTVDLAHGAEVNDVALRSRMGLQVVHAGPLRLEEERWIAGHPRPCRGGVQEPQCLPPPPCPGAEALCGCADGPEGPYPEERAGGGCPCDGTQGWKPRGAALGGSRWRVYRAGPWLPRRDLPAV